MFVVPLWRAGIEYDNALTGDDRTSTPSPGGSWRRIGVYHPLGCITLATEDEPTRNRWYDQLRTLATVATPTDGWDHLPSETISR